MNYFLLIPVAAFLLIGCTTTYRHPEHGGTVAAGTLGVLLDEKEICKAKVPDTITRRTMGVYDAADPLYDSKKGKFVAQKFGPLNPPVVNKCGKDCRQAKCEREEFIHRCMLERGWTRTLAFNPRECSGL